MKKLFPLLLLFTTIGCRKDIGVAPKKPELSMYTGPGQLTPQMPPEPDQKKKKSKS